VHVLYKMAKELKTPRSITYPPTHASLRHCACIPDANSTSMVLDGLPFLPIIDNPRAMLGFLLGFNLLQLCKIGAHILSRGKHARKVKEVGKTWALFE